MKMKKRKCYLKGLLSEMKKRKCYLKGLLSKDEEEEVLPEGAAQ